MKITNRKIFQLHANFCKVFSSPTRLMIIALLHGQEMSVGEIAQATETALPTISQHLRVLRERQILTSRKEGQNVYYSLVDPRLWEACTNIRQILLDTMKKSGIVANEIDAVGVSFDED